MLPCRGCRSTEHAVEDCPETATWAAGPVTQRYKTNTAIRRADACLNCGLRGHWSRECPHPPSGKGGKGLHTDGQSQEAPATESRHLESAVGAGDQPEAPKGPKKRSAMCFTCGKPRHLGTECQPAQKKGVKRGSNDAAAIGEDEAPQDAAQHSGGKPRRRRRRVGKGMIAGPE